MGVDEGNLQIIDVDMTLENCSPTRASLFKEKIIRLRYIFL